MKPKFEGLQIEFWVHFEKLGQSSVSLCLFHKDVGKGIELLNALNELESHSLPSQRVLTFASSSRKTELRRLKLLRVESNDDLKVMSIQFHMDTATIEMTHEGANLLVEGITAWLGGAEDFGVSPRSSTIFTKHLGIRDRESAELWFWGPTYTGP